MTANKILKVSSYLQPCHSIRGMIYVPSCSKKNKINIEREDKAVYPVYRGAWFGNMYARPYISNMEKGGRENGRRT
jgi:hypothetical protein